MAVIKPLPPIESDELMNRFYIPVSPDYEIQTKGNGSSFRIAMRNGDGHRWLICDGHLHRPLEEMGRNIHQYIVGLHQDREALQAKIDALMLEYCPDEMTAEQIANWEVHQKPVAE